MSDETKPGDLYDASVGDGTKTPAPHEPSEKPNVVESNASNYGASAIPLDREETEAGA